VRRAHTVPKSAWIAVAAVTLGTAAGLFYRGTRADGREDSTIASMNPVAVESKLDPAPSSSGREPSEATEDHRATPDSDPTKPSGTPDHPGRPVAAEGPGKRFGTHQARAQRGLPAPLIGFLEAGGESPLMDAATAFANGDRELCLTALRETPPPLTQPQKMVYFELLALVGEPHEVTIALQHTHPPPRGSKRKQPWMPKVLRGGFSKPGRRNQ